MNFQCSGRGRKAVGSKSIKNMGMDENFNEQVVSSHFIRCYRSEVAKG